MFSTISTNVKKNSIYKYDNIIKMTTEFIEDDISLDSEDIVTKVGDLEIAVSTTKDSEDIKELIEDDISLDSEIIFTTDDKKIRMYHKPERYEDKWIYSIKNTNYLLYNKILEYKDIKEFLLDDFVGLEVNNISIDSEIIFTTDDKKIRMYHKPDCCESVWIHSIKNINHLLYNKILKVEEICNDDSYDPKTEKGKESFLWTFYKFTTEEGIVKIRWFGSSTGYYDEGVILEYVDMKKIEDKCRYEK